MVVVSLEPVVGGGALVGEGQRGGQRALSAASRPVREAHRPQIHRPDIAQEFGPDFWSLTDLRSPQQWKTSDS
jgi:hypothetical protein